MLFCGLGEGWTKEESVCRAHCGRIVNDQNQDTRRQEQLLRAALSAGRSVVVDNTNPRPEDSRPLVRLGHEHGAKVLGYFFEASVRECLRRNEMREGKARVPDVAIYATVEKLVAPSIVEGFDELFCVRLNGFAYEVHGC